ncbi:hypothetical protein ACFFGH_33995 [Lysobacter korlensis]|uniref:Integron gene cassette protein n=1 Tax=Lysobacter korlensis TaxID=553636 RepID=A0ABV6S2B5_9GAMM
MEFPSLLESWLNDAARQLQPGVRAFAFNLFEPAGMEGVKYGVELIGSDRYADSDDDWPCDEVWEPEPRALAIPLAFSGSAWTDCLERVRGLLAQYVESPSGAWLTSAEAVAVGFVDGDLHRIWTASGKGA